MPVAIHTRAGTMIEAIADAESRYSYRLLPAQGNLPPSRQTVLADIEEPASNSI